MHSFDRGKEDIFNRRESTITGEGRPMVRIPTHGPPTHPGTMLLEGFLLAWDLYHATHSPAAKAIRKIRRLPALARAGAD